MDTIKSERFLRIDMDDFRVIAAQSNLQFLLHNRHWFFDGTFRVSLDGFDQLYTIHGFRDGVTYPCVYACLPW